MSRLDVTIQGAGKTRAMLSDLARGALNLTPALASAAGDVQTETSRLWDAPRKALAASTVARKRRQGLPSTPLVATGETQDAARNLVKIVTPYTLTLSVPPGQSRYHRAQGRNVMPDTRRVVGITMREVYRHLDVDKR